MKDHLSEQQIQQLSFDSSDYDSETSSHFQECELCQKEVQNYKLLFIEVSKQPVPQFEYDVSKMVMERILLKQKPAFERYLVFTVICCTVLLGVFTLIVFSNNILILFLKINAYTVYLIISTFLFLMLGLGVDIYLKYIRLTEYYIKHSPINNQ